MASIMHLGKLKGVPSSTTKQIYQSVRNIDRPGLTLRIKKYDPPFLSIQAFQTSSLMRPALSDSALTRLVQQALSPFFKPEFVNLILAPPPKSLCPDVTVSWIQKNIKTGHLKTTKIAAEMGISRTQLSSLISGNRPLSQPMKALFYFYFHSKKLENILELKTNTKRG